MSSANRYRLIVRKGPLPGKVYDLAKSVLVLGREVKNDIVINDSEISRQHVRLTEQPGGWQVEDLASTNGAFVNGERLTGPRLLKPGDVLGLGETVQLEYSLVTDSADRTMMAAPSEPPAAEAPAEAPVPGLFSLPASEPPPAAPPPVSELPPSAPPPSSGPSGAGPSYSLPPSTPPAPPPQKSGIPTWAWAVGIGCAVLACCACSAIVAVTVLLPALGISNFSP
jgi:hypothetical protein